MFPRVLLLLFCATWCAAKTIHTMPSKFRILGETPNTDTDDETLSYLNHPYYDVSYKPLTQWDSIASSGNISKMSGMDDPPPFEVVSFHDQGWFFPFYGHAHPVIYIDSNGFLSMVPRYCPHYGFCNWQEPEGHQDSQYQRYIAPMMTDFNPSRFGDCNITFKFDMVNGEKQLTVQWTNVVLFSFHNPNFSIDKDGFTFQAVLHENGDIIFNYKKLPYYPGNETLTDTHSAPKRYPIMMGVEDAVIVKRGDKSVLADYAPLNLDANKIYDLVAQHGGATVTHRALPTCPEFKSCYSCVNYTLSNAALAGRLKCGWCEQDKICADVMGRESSSLSAGCLANNMMLGSFSQCDNIGKTDKLLIEGTPFQVVVVCVTVIAVCACFIAWLLCYMKKMKSQLAQYSKGLPGDAESANNARNIPGMHNSAADSKVEMSA